MHYNSTRKIHTFQDMEDAVAVVTLNFGFQLISTFQGAFAFILALQSHEFINIVLETNKFDSKKFAIMMIFILVNIFTSYTKDLYVRRAGDNMPQIREGEEDIESLLKAQKPTTHNHHRSSHK
jgi:hypothetical protein